MRRLDIKDSALRNPGSDSTYVGLVTDTGLGERAWSRLTWPDKSLVLGSSRDVTYHFAALNTISPRKASGSLLMEGRVAAESVRNKVGH